MDAGVRRPGADPARTPFRRAPGRRVEAGQASSAGTGEGAGTVGCVPRPGARRERPRAAEARADVGDHRALHDVDDDLRCASARQREHGVARARCHRRAEGALAVAQPARRDLERVRADGAVSRGRRPDRHRDDGDEGRRRVGHRRPQVVHHQRVGLRHRPGVRGDQPRRPPAPARVGVRRADRDTGHGDRARHRHDGASRPSPTAASATTPRSSSPTAGYRPTT